MRTIHILSLIVATALVTASCDTNSKKHSSAGHVYMPDMAYSRAYEDYAARDTQVFTRIEANRGTYIFFNEMPVKGTIKRGGSPLYLLPKDSSGYSAAAATPNPITSMTEPEMAEAARQYNINCAICHGSKGLGDGPLVKNEKFAGVANLTSPMYVAMKDGTMFYSITYGRNLMGSYASQLTQTQRWQIIKYIRTLQPTTSAETGSTTAAAENQKTTAETPKKG